MRQFNIPWSVIRYEYRNIERLLKGGIGCNGERTFANRVEFLQRTYGHYQTEVILHGAGFSTSTSFKESHV